MIPKEIADQLYFTTGLRTFSEDYKTEVFFAWFNAGKPSPKGLSVIIRPVPGTDISPSPRLLQSWIEEDFQERAKTLDDQMITQLTELTIDGKIEMVKRHIEVAKEMQQIALNYLHDHQDDMNANAAVRLLVEGLRVERESSGIPEALEKMTQMSDEDLLKEIGDIISKSPGRLEAGE